MTESAVGEFQFSPGSDSKLDKSKGKEEKPHFIHTDPSMRRYEFKGLVNYSDPLEAIINPLHLRKAFDCIYKKMNGERTKVLDAVDLSIIIS